MSRGATGGVDLDRSSERAGTGVDVDVLDAAVRYYRQCCDSGDRRDVAVLLRDRLIGTFRLVSLEARRSDGVISYPLGEHPSGMFIFDRDGNFSVQLMNPDRDATGSDGYVGLWGTYEVDEDGQFFTATPEGALQPEIVAAPFVRHVTFADGLGVFNTPPVLVDGIETTTYITWRPVTAS